MHRPVREFTDFYTPGKIDTSGYKILHSEENLFVTPPEVLLLHIDNRAVSLTHRLQLPEFPEPLLHHPGLALRSSSTINKKYTPSRQPQGQDNQNDFK